MHNDRVHAANGSSQPVLEAHNISRKFDQTVFDNLSLNLKRGEVVAIVGQSGCGKTTLLNILAGLTPADSGQLTFKGDPLNSPGRVGYVQQQDHLLPWRNVLENARIGLELRMATEAANQLVKQHAPIFGLEHALTRRVNELSGGMRQRVAFLRTYLVSRDVLLLDEPFGALDAITRRELQKWLAEVLLKQQITAVIVTHDINEALALADRVLVMTPPPARFAADLTVSVKRPRTHNDLNDQRMIGHSQQLLELLGGNAE